MEKKGGQGLKKRGKKGINWPNEVRKNYLASGNFFPNSTGNGALRFMARD